MSAMYNRADGPLLQKDTLTETPRFVPNDTPQIIQVPLHYPISKYNTNSRQ
jgi:hypothetical protein